MTGCIAFVCVLLLAISAYINSPHSKEQEKTKSEQSQQPALQTTDSGGKKQVQQQEQVAAVTENSDAERGQSSVEQTPTKEPASETKATPETKTPSEKKTSSETKTSSERKTSAETKSSTETKSSSKTSKNTDASNTKTSSAITTPSASKVVPPSDNSQKQTSPSSPIEPFAIPQAAKGATLVFIFDDAGQSVAKVKRYTSLPIPLTIAVLPQVSHSKECADAVRAAGKEVMLHQPMQAENLKLNPGAGAISPDMSTYEIASLLKKNLSEVGPVKGINNHEGSLITEDVIKIGAVLDVAAEEGVYFLDSRTTAATKAPQAALERDMTIFERDVFLDDVVNRDRILDQIYRALGIANKKGRVIIIGHVDKSSDIIPSLLREMYPYLQQKGYRFATLSQLK